MRVATTILLAIGMAGCSRTKANLPPANPLRAEKDTIRVVGTGDRDDERTVAFKLTNTSEADLTITNVDSSCTCVLVSDFKNVTLAAGKTFALEAKVSPPPYGRKLERIRVANDATTEKLELSVVLVGGQHVPHFPAQLRTVDFPALASTGETRDLFLRTYEPVDKPRWLGEVKCEFPDVVVEYIGHEDRQMNEAALQRRYQYRVSWKTLPKETEFEGRLEVSFHYGEESSSPFGFVTGRLADRDLFSPRTVVLRPGKQTSEQVHFSPQFADCRIDADAGVPESLKTSWEMVGERRVLVVALADGNEGTGKVERPSTPPNSAEFGYEEARLQKHTIAVVNSTGESASVPVMILP